MINLSQPYVTDGMRAAVQETMKTRWIGQGPKVNEFEEKFSKQLGTLPAVAVGSGTDALHLAYLLAGIEPGDEVLVPVYTCAATNLPLLWMGAKLVFVDIDKDTLNIDPKDVARKVTDKTKAIVTMEYDGTPCDYDAIDDALGSRDIPIIDDASNAIGAKYKGIPIGSLANYTTFSFMAIKNITTGDGGMVTMSEEDVERAKRLRWFGVDRNKKLDSPSKWDEDIKEIGYKYQMTDIAASMGIAGLDTLNKQIERRREMINQYVQGFSGGWLLTIIVDDRDELMKYLNKQGIQASPMYYRNDKYKIFKEFRNDCPNMDELEDKILCLPFHMGLTNDDIDKVTSNIGKFYGGR